MEGTDWEARIEKWDKGVQQPGTVTDKDLTEYINTIIHLYDRDRITDKYL